MAVWAVVGSAFGQRVVDPVADLFEPYPALPPGVREQPIGPLRLPDAALGGTNAGAIRMAPRGRPAPPPRPPFPLKDGDRILLLGDGVFEAEAHQGYLETRLQIQHPTNAFLVRNLSGSAHNRLRESDPAVAEKDLEWLTNLVEEVRAVRPDVTFLSYGTAPALGGMSNLVAFSNVYSRLIEGLVTLDTVNTSRVVVCSPLSYEPAAGETLTDLTNRNQVLIEFADTAWQIATRRQLEFVDFFLFSRNDLVAAARERAEGARPKPPLTQGAATPTAYGLWRLCFALERGLRWPSANWRFGLQADGSWREGGFGARIASHVRRDDFVQVNFTEDRLPVPNPQEDVDLLAEFMPACYIQVRALKDGLYELRVDGTPVLRGTHLDWHRYEVIRNGPSWSQSESLRKAIVAKNARWLEAWQSRAETTPADAEAADAAVVEQEAGIAQLKRPVARVYQLVRVGEAPKDAEARLSPEPLKR